MSDMESSDSNFKCFPRGFKCGRGENFKSHITVTVLFFLNLLNYIDRFTLAGILSEIQGFYKINDSLAGLLQTLFVCSYMIFAPLFGYLGDRYSRKAIMIFGVTFWSLTTLCGSFIPADMFWLFIIFRSFVGIGEASYSCVAPTIIGDLFTNEMRIRMLAVFYLATPLGSGLGYIIGSNVASALSDWRWSLRITPPLGLLCVIVLIILVNEPKRGGAEGLAIKSSTTNLKSDLIYVFKKISLIFGAVTCVSGLFGVGIASLTIERLRIITSNADPLLCALGSFIATPTLFVCILIPRFANIYLYWFLVFIGVTSMCLCWSLVADIILYTVEPNRRSIASAMNILMCHLFGDAISPYIIGVISDSLRQNLSSTYFNRFTSLQSALYVGPFFMALSFGSYLFASIYLDDDKKHVDDFVKNPSSAIQKQVSVFVLTKPEKPERGVENPNYNNNSE